MIATSMTYVEPRPTRQGSRPSRRGDAGSLPGDPALRDQFPEGTEESTGKKGRGGQGRPGEDPPGQPDRLLSTEEQHDLAARIKAGDQAAREALIVANFGLVCNIARRYHSPGATLDDLIQEGSRGLILAVDRYDPKTHNTRFSTYATYWIRNTIQRAVAANFSLVRLPDYMFRLIRQSRRVGEELAAKEEAATDVGPAGCGSTELGSRSKASRRRLQLLNQAMISGSSYYGDDAGGEETTLEETIADGHRPEHDLLAAEELDELHRALDRLTPVEAWLIRRRFGMADPRADWELGVRGWGLGELDTPTPNFPAPNSFSPSLGTLAGRAAPAQAAPRSRRWTYARLGRALGLSVHRVRQIEQRALEKLRGSLRNGLSARRSTRDCASGRP